MHSCQLFVDIQIEAFMYSPGPRCIACGMCARPCMTFIAQDVRFTLQLLDTIDRANAAGVSRMFFHSAGELSWSEPACGQFSGSLYVSERLPNFAFRHYLRAIAMALNHLGYQSTWSAHMHCAPRCKQSVIDYT